MLPKQRQGAGKMPNSVFTVVLCEDLQSWVFLRRVLIEQGAAGRDIRANRQTPGVAGGADRVRQQYAPEVQAQRRRNASRAAALVVHIDADRFSVLERANELAAVLAASGAAPRAPAERIAHAIPRRNIETWIAFGLGQTPVDETEEYRKLSGCEADYAPASKRFATDIASGADRAGAPPSWNVAIAEMRRVC